MFFHFTTSVPVIPDFLLSQRKLNTSSIIQNVLNDMNNSCDDFFHLNPSKTPKKYMIWASKGHNPQQHLIMMFRQILAPNPYRRYKDEDSIESFIRHTPLTNASQHSMELLTRLKACHGNATEKVRLLGDRTLKDEHILVGLMFASKSIVQLMVNPLIGPLTNR